MKIRAALSVLAGSAVLAALVSTSHAQQHAMVSDAALIAKLNKAAPANIVAHATVMNMGSDGKMKVIRKGTNGWTCMDPGESPMCADQAAMDWVDAWQKKGPAPQKLGFIYMLRGDNGASNTDPYATKKTADNNWIKTGSHVMIVGAEAKSLMQAYPRAAKADPTQPYVMWPGTPYEHLMLPVK